MTLSRKISVVLLFFLLAVSPLLAMGEKQAPMKSQPASLDFSLPDIHGKTVKLSDYRGKVVMLNFWASWCPPCREEMPAMQKLHERLAKEAFAILAVNIEPGGSEKVRDYLKKNGLTFKVLFGGEEIAYRWSIRSIPTTYLINKKGDIVQTIIGPRDWVDADNLEMFMGMIKQ
ncbi:MAG: TlpA family protein disulfide reductase [Candidatus Margulisbacteria bacterium]|nr:TlpA family protein disulfide reductase [Candidatus Margulisiibacteriota bacterium]MBU1616633.1 TlpA family protein disulfide reductase [Candidatus Margulisiibacteriota bacterium]MBU1866976.1 TlpA family protein disulfide reductase [Candidatus Margulisiibacteriota bacterium]